MKYLACVVATSCAVEAYEQFGMNGVIMVAVIGYVAAHILYRKITQNKISARKCDR